ncbi:MAG TPA: Ig-like domain-containing protein [Candidatus Limnocylindrales bacterium]|jgi:subtilisin family serine protease
MSGYRDRRHGPARARPRLRVLGLAIGLVGLLGASTAQAVVAVAAPDGGVAAESVKAIVTFDAKPGKAAEQAVTRSGGNVRKALGLINGLAIDIPRGKMEALSHEPHVRSVELDATLTMLEPMAAPAPTGDLEYDNAWGVTKIGSKDAHDAGFKGQGVKVAIIDTGIDYIHNDPDDVPYVVDPEFNSNYQGGYDFVNNDADPMDDNGHGTHVAGILAAEKNGYLVVGVAPQVDLYALKILDADGNGDESNLILALQWAVDHDIDVVNMSLGTHDIVPALQTAIQNAAASGVLLVAASGNTVTLTELFLGCPVAYPGAYPEVLSTTFTNVNDALTGLSCTGPEVDFAAPGDAIFSPVPVGTCMLCSDLGYAAESGTSMASPHLAGSVALLLSAGITDQGAPGLFDDVKNRLCATATVGFGVEGIFGGSTPIPTSDPRYPDYFGCGVVNAGAAVTGLNPPPPNNPPDAVNDDANATEDLATDIAVLANDTDPDGDGLTVTAVTDPPHGLATINGNGTVHYVPDANYAGDDAFSYTVSDGHGGSDSASVAVHLQAAPDPPVAVDDAATTAEDTPVDVAVLANDSDADGDVLTVTGVGAGVKGTPSINGDGTVHFVPSPNANGAGSFTYSVSDGHGGTDNGSVSVTITPVNDAPVAVNDAATTSQGTPVTISVLANDTDVEGTALSVGSASDPPHGSVVINANGTITYTPDPGYSGPDAFGYSASDGSASSNVATVSITVNPGPPPNPFHVGDLDGSTSRFGKTWTARVTIRVETAAHAALGSAVVTGSFSAGAAGTVTCTTAADGTCTVQVTKLSRISVASVTFTVTNVTRSGWSYTPDANHDPDADSNGTSILILRPA